MAFNRRVEVTPERSSKDLPELYFITRIEKAFKLYGSYHPTASAELIEEEWQKFKKILIKLERSSK